MKIIFTALLFFSVYLTSAQNPPTEKKHITVIDSQTKETIPYVTICFECNNGKIKKYSITNIEGMIENIAPEENCKIAISFIGYKTLRSTISPNSNKTFELESDFFKLEQITVTGTRTEKHLKDAPVITQVITSQDIETRGLTSVSDVLTDDMPGINFQQTGYGLDIKMQGLGANYILFLIDGERMAGETDGNIDYSRLNTANIERIEIVKGASSTLYGSQAMGGVINIITKKTRKKIELSVGSQFKTYNQVNHPDLQTTDNAFIFSQNLDRPNLNNNISLGFNFKKISTRTDFVVKSFDAYKLYDSEAIQKAYSNIDTTIFSPISEEATHIDGFDDFTITQKVKFKANKKLSITLNGSYYNHKQYDFVKEDNIFKNYIDITYGGNINYQFNPNTSAIITFNSDTYDKYNQSEKTNKKRHTSSHKFLNSRFLITNNFKKHSVTIGSEFIKESLLSYKFTYGETTEKESETYIFLVQDDVKLSEKLNIITGLRSDYHSSFGLNITPKASLMYKIKTFTLRTNYAKGFRAPNLKELYMNWDHLGLFTIKGSEDLKPETNNYFSFSGEYTKKKTNTSITIYHNRFKNKIEGQWTNNQTVYQYFNLSEAKLSGADFSLKYRVLNNFSISSGYSYLYDNNINIEGIKVSSTSPHSGNIRLEHKFRKKFYNATFNLSGNFHGAKEFDVSDEAIIFRGEEVAPIYRINYSAYSIWKFTLAQNLYNGINFILGIDNIFDYKADIVSFSSSTTVGRRFFVSLNINFDKLYDYRKTSK